MIFLDFSGKFFGFLGEIFGHPSEFCLDFLVKFFRVTRLERPKGVKDEVKQAEGPKAGPGPGLGGPGGRPKSRGPTCPLDF